MFEKFGEFDSVEELNRAAAAQKEEGDLEAVKAIAEENGIDVGDAEDYIDGCVEELATARMAAIGKIELETKELEIKGILEDWKDVMVEMCMTDEEMCRAVRKKGKNLAGCMAKLIAFAFENKVQISDKIVDMVKIQHNGKTEKMRKPLYMGVPNKAEVKKMAKEYYVG